jgi:hypothetical protein
MIRCLLLLGSLLALPAFAADERPRLFVLTDIENEPDDAESMVRLLVHSSQFEIEGLVATTSVWQPNRTAPERIRRIVDAYAQVRDQLAKHERGFPAAHELKRVVFSGLPVFGMKGVGEGKDSAGSTALIAAVDRADARPLWITAWGGTNVLAQALWKVSHSRSKPELARFVAKLRVYAISDQDDSGPWLRETFPDLFYIVSPGYQEHDGGGYHHATWTGISGDRFHGRFDGADFSLVSNEWLGANVIENHGPLGAEYPHWEYLMEGDTPSFLYLFPNGLGSPDHPGYGSWGGRYELYTPHERPWHYRAETRPIWTNAIDEVVGVDGQPHNEFYATIWRWRAAYQNEFAARMDWCVKEFAEANHPPIARLAHSSQLTTRREASVQLSAAGSSDPDGDALSYRWFIYREAGTYMGEPEIEHPDAREAKLTIPNADLRGAPPTRTPKTVHVILEVTDDGEPALTRYRRTIVNIEESQ